MSLTKFVTNVKDLSDDGGYKFRFCCDHCGNGVESHYISAGANLLKTGLQIFEMFRPGFGFGAQGAINGIDRGLRGKERDAAYEQAAQEAMVFFKQCSHCEKWVCTRMCWDGTRQVCVGCSGSSQVRQASPATGLSSQEEAQIQRTIGTVKAAAGAFGINLDNIARQIPTKACPKCHAPSATNAKFCPQCGTGLQPKACTKCGCQLGSAAKFCVECGTQAA